MANTTNLTDYQKETMLKRECLRCGEPIPPKRKGTSWVNYEKQKYCGDECKMKAMNNEPLEGAEDATDGLTLSKYVMQKTGNGRLMADWYIKVLEILNDKALKKKQHCLNCHVVMINGVRVSDEMVKNASKWLTDNAFGKPGARNEDGSDINDLNEHKKFLERYLLQDLSESEVEELERYKKQTRELLRENAGLRDEIHRLQNAARGGESQAFEDSHDEPFGKPEGNREKFMFSTERMEDR